MHYREVSISVANSEIKDILIAFLTEAGYESFEEREATLLAYIPEDAFDQEELIQILQPINLSFSSAEIAHTNWNKQWEENFEPVTVDDFCFIRADFHEQNETFPYEIVITPKMSFGTGHHATTQIMIRMMRGLEWTGRKVLDFGTGTGVLAILAAKLGAQTVMAIDNDEWAYTNALENVERNRTGEINARCGVLSDVLDSDYDVILANINRHILLESMRDLHGKLKTGGKLLMSGLLSEDQEVVSKAALSESFAKEQEVSSGGWIGLSFTKY
jgi:ribosomal protein L11 methyltransferase